MHYKYTLILRMYVLILNIRLQCWVWVIYQNHFEPRDFTYGIQRRNMHSIPMSIAKKSVKSFIHLTNRLHTQALEVTVLAPSTLSGDLTHPQIHMNNKCYRKELNEQYLHIHVTNYLISS